MVKILYTSRIILMTIRTEKEEEKKNVHVTQTTRAPGLQTRVAPP